MPAILGDFNLGSISFILGRFIADFLGIIESRPLFSLNTLSSTASEPVDFCNPDL